MKIFFIKISYNNFERFAISAFSVLYKRKRKNEKIGVLKQKYAEPSLLFHSDFDCSLAKFQSLKLRRTGKRSSLLFSLETIVMQFVVKCAVYANRKRN